MRKARELLENKMVIFLTNESLTSKNTYNYISINIE